MIIMIVFLKPLTLKAYRLRSNLYLQDPKRDWTDHTDTAYLLWTKTKYCIAGKNFITSSWPRRANDASLCQRSNSLR